MGRGLPVLDRVTGEVYRSKYAAGVALGQELVGIDGHKDTFVFHKLEQGFPGRFEVQSAPLEVERTEPTSRGDWGDPNAEDPFSPKAIAARLARTKRLRPNSGKKGEAAMIRRIRSKHAFFMGEAFIDNGGYVSTKGEAGLWSVFHGHALLPKNAGLSPYGLAVFQGREVPPAREPRVTRRRSLRAA